jgi:ribose transport system permease protein
MTVQTSTSAEAPAVDEKPAPSRGSSVMRVLRAMRIDRFSGVYVLVLLIVLFGIWVPDTFLTVSNVLVIASSVAITAMIAIVLLLPLAAGVFDLSVAANVGLATVVALDLVSRGDNIVLAMLAAIGVSAVVGLFNGFVVNILHVDSLIATLGTSSLLAAASYWVCDGGQITLPSNSSLNNLGVGSWLQIPKPTVYLIVVAIVLWYLLEYTPLGRAIYATGGNMQAARLAGVRVNRIVLFTLVAAGVLIGVIGVVLASMLGSGNPTVGTSYLLPAFSAAFLGTTQVIPGRFNVPGTVVAIVLLSTGVEGLQLAGAPVWVTDVFDGAALILAVALAARGSRRT